MLKFLHRSYGWLTRILIAFGVLLAVAAGVVVLSLRYWILPDIEQYHDDVTQAASQAIGLPVTIGKISGGWRGLRPNLTFNDVRLYDAHGNNTLILKQVDNVLSWMTVLTGELRLHALEIDEPDLLVRRDKQGRLHIAGLQAGAQGGDGKLSDWLLHQAHIRIRNGHVVWQDELYDRPALVLQQVQFLLENGWRHHRFAVRISPSDMTSSVVDIRGDLVGSSFNRLEDWHGELFTQMDFVDTSAWAPWVTFPDAFKHARGGLRAWIGIKAGKVERVTADMDMSDIQARLGDAVPALDLEELHGRVGATLLEHGFEVAAHKLSLQMRNGFRLPPSNFSLRLSGGKDNGFQSGMAETDSLNLADVATLAQYVPMSDAVRQKLVALAPSGYVTDLHADWGAGDDKRPRFGVRARFHDIVLHRVEHFPGIENLSGQINGNDSGGSLSLISYALKVDAPDLLLGPVGFGKFTVQAGWQRNADGWDIKLNDLSIANADLAGTAYGSFLLPQQGAGVADLSVNLTRASVAHAARYLPKELLGAPTMDWLQTGLLGGEASMASIRLRGNLDDFPFPEKRKGIFRVEVKARDVVIDYAKDWPRVEDANATLLIEGSKLQVDSDSAMLAGARAQRVNVVIPDLMSDDPVLKINGEASGPTKYGLNFIKHSPVRGYTDGFTDDTTARGDGRLNLQLDIPLSDKPTKVAGTYHFDENDINFGGAIPMARKVTGDLLFTESQLSSHDINAQILGGPATIAIKTSADGTLQIGLRGKVDMTGWRKVNSFPELRALSGSAAWTGDVSVKGEQFSVTVNSTLKGLGSTLPVPLEKRAEEEVPVSFELRSATPTQDIMWLRYGDLISARMLRAQDKSGSRSIKRGYINFGPARRMPDRDGMWMAGSLPELSLEGWRDLLPDGGGDGDMGLPALDGLDMSVQRLVGYGNVINGASIHARNHEGVMNAQLNSPNLRGELNWFPQGNGKLVVRLKSLVTAKLETAEAGKPAAPSSSPAKTGKAVSIPVIDAVVEHLVYRGKTIGRLELNASQHDKDVLLDHFRLANADGMVEASGKWGMMPAQTHLAIKLTLSDAGNMLVQAGYPSSIKNGSGTLDCDLVWPGAPSDLALSRMDGHMDVKLEKGRFLKLDPGAGKLLSVLSLQALPKRITLDFNDVFSQGFEFDNIDGVAQIKQGIMTTSDFKIKGSAAAVNLSGQVDLPHETQNLQVKVMPTIGDSVSLLAFAAGPAVGAGVFLANKLLRDPLDKLVAFEYNVTGSWADPKVEKIGQSAVPAK